MTDWQTIKQCIEARDCHCGGAWAIEEEACLRCRALNAFERTHKIILESAKAAESGYGKTRGFIDENVPEWVHGDDGPIYWAMKLFVALRKITA